VVIRNISDTALWVAVYRGQENERSDALFRDPFAMRLAGERGKKIVEAMGVGARGEWAFVMRTYLFDTFIMEQVARGTDLVINLAAGLDARPYRLDLPATLQWIEVDLPDLIRYKEEILKDEKPRCSLERITIDLADAEARRNLFRQLGQRGRKALIITEGLIIYLTAEEVAAFAKDLAAQPSFYHWVLDLASPGLLKMMMKQVGSQLERASAPLKFAPAEGPGFFEPHGWRPAAVRSMLKTAAKLRRVGWFFRLLARLPESSGRQGSRPWSAVCLMERRGQGLGH
jgi:methyltransferase (TIGR00027 family)